MSEQIEVQNIHADEAPQEVQRSLTTTVVEVYLGGKLLDKALDNVVSDAYGAAKDAVKAGWAKLHPESSPPKADPPS